MGPCILLIDDVTDSAWIQAINNAVADLEGSVQVVPPAQFDGTAIPGRFDLIVLDSNAIPDLSALIQQVLIADPAARAIVFSPIPAWREAREAMRAGAVDYQQKSLNEDEILARLRRHLLPTTSSEVSRGF
jgi:DNA-binding NtrC family response regulator